MSSVDLQTSFDDSEKLLSEDPINEQDISPSKFSQVLRYTLRTIVALLIFSLSLNVVLISHVYKPNISARLILKAANSYCGLAHFIW